MSDSRRKSKCVVCREKSAAESGEAVGLLLTGAKALFDGDEDTVRNCMDVSTPYDFHIAVTMFADALLTLSAVFGLDVTQMIDAYREDINGLITGAS